MFSNCNCIELGWKTKERTSKRTKCQWIASNQKSRNWGGLQSKEGEVYGSWGIARKGCCGLFWQNLTFIFFGAALFTCRIADHFSKEVEFQVHKQQSDAAQHKYLSLLSVCQKQQTHILELCAYIEVSSACLFVLRNLKILGLLKTSSEARFFDWWKLLLCRLKWTNF